MNTSPLPIQFIFSITASFSSDVYCFSPNSSGSKRPMRSPSCPLSQNQFWKCKADRDSQQKGLLHCGVSTRPGLIYIAGKNFTQPSHVSFSALFILHEKQTNKNWGLGRQSDLPKVTGLVTQIHDNLKACFQSGHCIQPRVMRSQESTAHLEVILSNAKFLHLNCLY